MAFEFAFPDCLNEGQQLLPVPAGLQFHPSIGKIAHPTGDFKAAGFPPNAVPETNPLDVALKEQLNGGLVGRLFRIKMG